MMKMMNIKILNKMINFNKCFRIKILNRKSTKKFRNSIKICFKLEQTNLKIMKIRK